jgi:hypothetical protein
MHRRANTSERNPSSRQTCPAGTASRRVPAAERRDPAGAGGGPGMRRNTASPPCPGIRRTGGERQPDRVPCHLVLQRRQNPRGRTRRRRNVPAVRASRRRSRPRADDDSLSRRPCGARDQDHGRAADAGRRTRLRAEPAPRPLRDRRRSTRPASARRRVQPTGPSNLTANASDQSARTPGIE